MDRKRLDGKKVEILYRRRSYKESGSEAIIGRHGGWGFRGVYGEREPLGAEGKGGGGGGGR